MNEYNSIAGIYDRINSGVDYEKWADFIERLYGKYLGKKPELVLDLCCGTGKMTLEMAKRGYDMIGIDASPDMLAVANDAVYDEKDAGKLSESAHPLFLCQDMRAFELYGTVGAILCCLDSLNYLTGDGELEKVFSLAHNYLDPGGLFIFDMNAPHKFETAYGENAYVYDVDGDAGNEFCVWQNFYDKETRICDFFLSVFREEKDGKYTRTDEEQRERCYSESEIRSALEKAGFELLSVSADYSGKKPGDDTDRLYFCAKAIKEG